MFVGENHLRMTVLVSGGLHVVNLQVLIFLVLIDSKVVVLLANDFLVSLRSKILLTSL